MEKVCSPMPRWRPSYRDATPVSLPRCALPSPTDSTAPSSPRVQLQLDRPVVQPFLPFLRSKSPLTKLDAEVMPQSVSTSVAWMHSRVHRELYLFFRMRTCLTGE